VQISDASAGRRLREGDPAAYDLVFAHYRPRIYGFLLRMSRRPEVADELLQETFLRLARHAGRLHPDTRLGVWLFAVARNLWRSWARWSILDGERLGEHAMRMLGRAPATPAELADAAETARLLEHAIAALTPGLREVALLMAVEHLETGEVAEILSLTPEAVRQRWSRARAALAVALEVRDVA
jgi:RNA polymerase sigma-70 factor (ECF subfamily)